jgi:hypothetical protein
MTSMTTPSATTAASLAIAILSTGSLFAEVKPHPLFSDGAVLQRGQVVPVWGTARDGEKVTVELGGQKLTTSAQNGAWQVDLKPLTVGGPFTIRTPDLGRAQRRLKPVKSRISIFETRDPSFAQIDTKESSQLH